MTVIHKLLLVVDIRGPHSMLIRGRVAGLQGVPVAIKQQMIDADTVIVIDDPHKPKEGLVTKAVNDSEFEVHQRLQIDSVVI